MQSAGMKMTRIMTAGALSLLMATAGLAHASSPNPMTGETYEIIKSYVTSEQTSDGSSGSSSGHDRFLERVIAVRDTGIELEYDLGRDATTEDRARNWQLPARMFKPAHGPMQLLNADELETRLEGWLKAGGWDRSVCGRWIFTWNAFHIDCDPQSIVKTIDEIDLRSPDLREGAAYQDASALAPGIIVRKAASAKRIIFTTLLQVDPVAVHRARAEADVATGEILQKPVTLEAALAERAKEQVSGTISVSFETDVTGIIWKRTKVTRLELKRPDGTSESRTATETVERHKMSTPAAR